VLAKGVIGNLLEVIPLHSDDRAQLQQFNAVVGSPFTARTLAIALGVSNPPLMIVGLIWGLWSATQIKPRDSSVPDAALTAHPPEMQVPGPATAGRSAVASASPAKESVVLLDRLASNADASALASVVGGASATDRPVQCDYCVMPMLYPREASLPR
jgi:hypothetical protein